MTLSLNNNWKFYALGLIILILFWLRFCQPSKKIIATKPDISKEVKKQDSLLGAIKASKFREDSMAIVSKKSDSVATAWQNKYRNFKPIIKNLPCDTALKKVVIICDSMANADSTALVDVKNQLKESKKQNNDYRSLHSTDSSIIGKQAEGLKQDSVKIAKLDRKVRFWKFMTKAAFVTGVAGGGYVGFKLP